MENSNLEIIFCLMFFTTAINGYDLCYNECNSSSGQQSLYEQYCCRPSNRGETVRIKEGKIPLLHCLSSRNTKLLHIK